MGRIDDLIIVHRDISKQYSMTVKNLRMATKYSFHVKPQIKPGDQKISGRSELNSDEFDGNSINLGQTIIIPTKGCKYSSSIPE